MSTDNISGNESKKSQRCQEFWAKLKEPGLLAKEVTNLITSMRNQCYRIQETIGLMLTIWTITPENIPGLANLSEFSINPLFSTDLMSFLVRVASEFLCLYTVLISGMFYGT
jgi:hypothetical protein